METGRTEGEDMKSGLVSVTFRGKNTDEIIALCKKNAVDVIEWGGDVHVPSGDYENAEKVGRQTRENGIEVFSYGSYYRLGEQKEWKEEFKKVLKTAACLQCNYIRIWAGTVSSRNAENAYFQRLEEELKQVCKMAAEEKMNIALEYHRNTLTEDWQSALRLIKETAEPNLFLYWQPNPDISHEERMNELCHLKEMICNVHTFFWEKANIRKPLEDGVNYWKDYTHILKEKDIPYMLEFVKDDEEKQFEEDMRVLQHQIIRRIQ